MSFAHPWVLLALLIPGAIIAWEALRTGGSGRAVAVPIDHARVSRRARRIPAWVLPGLLTAASVVPAVILGAAVLLLAGPQRLGPPGQERVLTNIELVLDVSGSMSSPIGYARAGASRYTAAMDAINVFTSRRKGDAFGLTIFGGEVVRWVPLTKDLSAIRNATPFLSPETMPGPMGSTRVGHALEYARGILGKQEGGDRLIVLITDGFSSDLDGPNAGAIASALRAEGIVVHAINVGDGPAPDQLYSVVLPTGGRVFDARDQRSLASIFEHIDRMHPVRIKPKEREPVDFFTPIALAGAALLGVHGLCLMGFRYTPW
jgi:Ca-activated chloride channel homolog